MLGIDPKIWGNSGWNLLHRISFVLKDIDSAKDFYFTLEHILPCMKCRRNITKHIGDIPFPRKIDNIPKWLYNIHNRVNISINTKSENPKYTVIVNKYSKMNDERINIENDLIFIYSLYNTHPGRYGITEIYRQNLERFLKIWIKNTINNNEIDLDKYDISTKKGFYKLIRRIYGERKIKKLVKCDTDLCTL